MGEPIATCSACLRQYRDGEEPPCPNCGGKARSFRGAEFDGIRLLGGLKLREFRNGFLTFESHSKQKFARASGKLAHESLIYDHTDPATTVKTHVVKEEEPDGSWTVVHDERQEFNARNRPPGTTDRSTLDEGRE